MRQKELIKAYKQKVMFIAIINVILALVDKVILVKQGSWGAPVVITVVLWCFLYQKPYKWAYFIYSIIVFITFLLGIYGAVAFVGYLYQNLNPFYCILAVVMGVNYFVSWWLLRKEIKRIGQ